MLMILTAPIQLVEGCWSMIDGCPDTNSCIHMDTTEERHFVCKVFNCCIYEFGMQVYEV